MTEPIRELRGDRNQCRGCGEYFNSTAAFDKHRTGNFHERTRRCMTKDEMVAKGMAQRADGFWVGSVMTNSYWDK